MKYPNSLRLGAAYVLILAGAALLGGGIALMISPTVTPELLRYSPWGLALIVAGLWLIALSEKV